MKPCIRTSFRCSRTMRMSLDNLGMQHARNRAAVILLSLIVSARYAKLGDRQKQVLYRICETYQAIRQKVSKPIPRFRHPCELTRVGAFLLLFGLTSLVF